ncbi:MAG TPA: T9SS type A sorting domain-containing protein, partial [Candidatus Kapabacteria bacterium]|nr:T9SS type A sorting domain-containing protein [Candidatus Kapabacteria bacterium]
LSGVPLTMEIYNILGQKVETVMDGEAVAEGDHSMTIETTRLPAGQYILRLSDGTTVDSRPFVVQK